MKRVSRCARKHEISRRYYVVRSYTNEQSSRYYHYYFVFRKQLAYYGDLGVGSIKLNVTMLLFRYMPTLLGAHDIISA